MPPEMRLLPVLVESGSFQSELVLTNPLSVPQTASLTFVESSSPTLGTGGSLTLSFLPGEQKIIPGALDYLRQHGVSIGPKGSATYAGTLSVTFQSGTSVSTGFVGARTATPVGGTGPGEYGLFYPGTGPSFAALNEAWVYGLQQNAGNRSNVAVANLGDAGDSIIYRIDVYDGDTGQLAGSISPPTLAPGGWAQVGAILRSFNVSNGYAHLVKLSGNSHFLAYGVVNDGGAPGEGTSDGSYVAGQVVPAPVALTWIPGSSVKVEQLLGDCDWPDLEQRSVCTPTASQTITKNDVEGTDLGYSFETPNGLMFLFGDTIGTKTLYHAGDTTALSQSTDPAGKVLLDFLTNSDGSTYLIKPPGVAMGADDVPDSGITLSGQIYILCSTGSDTSLPNPHVNDQLILTKFDPSTKNITTGRTISTMPEGHFVNIALHASGTDVLMFGLGLYRATDLYLASVPAASFESGIGTRYFAGLIDGQPTWTDQESGAVPIVVDNPLGHTPPDPPTIGNVSVVYSQDLGLWLMTYDGGRQTEATNGVYFSYASNPWGPWSPPQLIFNAKRDHALGVFIHDPSLVPDDLLDGPTINPTNNPPATTRGGVYAPFQIERFTTVVGDTLTITYTMSTWNPYTVVRMRSEFTIAHAP